MDYVAAADYNPGHCQRGALALMTSMIAHDGFVSLGCWNDRAIRGTEKRATPVWSTHREGRAIDMAVNARRDGSWVQPPGSWNTPAGSDPVLVERMRWWRTQLMAHHEVLGVQGIIFWREIWTCGYPELRPYRGPAGPHHDHAHIELHPSGAANLTTATLEAVLFPAVIPEDDMPPILWTHLGDDRILKEGPSGNPTWVPGMATVLGLETHQGAVRVELSDNLEWAEKLTQAGLSPTP